jgi:hypothetical protein
MAQAERKGAKTNRSSRSEGGYLNRSDPMEAGRALALFEAVAAIERGSQVLERLGVVASPNAFER